MKLNKLFINCIKHNQFQKNYVITYWNQYKSQYDIHEFTEQFDFTNKIDLKRGDNRVALSKISIYYTWKNIQNLYRNNWFKISETICDEEFKQRDRFYSILDIQNYFKYIIKNHYTLNDKPTIQHLSTEFRIKLHSTVRLNSMVGLYHIQKILRWY